MAVETPGAFVQSGSYPAEQSRHAWNFEIAAAGGVKGGFDFQMAAPVSGMSINVGGASGALDEAMLPGVNTTTQGIYYGHLSSQTNVSISASNPSNPRVDTLYAQQLDQAYSGVSSPFQLVIVAGTPTSGATLSNLTGIGAAPTTGGVLLIGYVLVPAGTTSIITADILQATPQAYLGNVGPFNARPASGSGTVTANSGDHIIVSSGNTPITLPKPFKNARVKVTNYGTGVPVVSHNASEVIWGLGLGSSGSSSFSLGTYGATATVESDGTSWYITAGNADSGWIVVGSGGSAPAFGSGWGALGGSAVTPAFRLQGNVVRLRGVFNGSAVAGTSPYTLPAGFRPSASEFFALSGGNALNLVSIASTGVIVSNSVGAANLPSLDGCTFTID